MAEGLWLPLLKEGNYGSLQEGEPQSHRRIPGVSSRATKANRNGHAPCTVRLTLCRSNSPIGILSIELHAVLDGKVFILPSNIACSSMERIPIGLLDRQGVNGSYQRRL